MQDNNMQQQNQNQQPNPAHVTSISKAILNGKLADIEPNQLASFIRTSKFTIKEFGEAIAQAAQSISKVVDNKGTSARSMITPAVKSMSACLMFMHESKMEKGQAINESAKKCGVDTTCLAFNISNNHDDIVMEAGKKLSDNSIKKSLHNINALVEGLSNRFGDKLTEDNKAIIGNMREELAESMKKQDILNSINEYYDIALTMRKAKNIMEECGLPVKSLKCNSMCVKAAGNSMNKTVSAIKYAARKYRSAK